MLFFTIKCYDLFHLSYYIIIIFKHERKTTMKCRYWEVLQVKEWYQPPCRHETCCAGGWGEGGSSNSLIFLMLRGGRSLQKRGVFLKGVSCTPSACYAFCNIKLCKVFVQILIQIYWPNSDYRVTSKCVLENWKNFCFMISETKYF